METWLILKNGQIFAIASEPVITVDDANASYSVCAANKMGGLSEAASTPTIIQLNNLGYATFYDSEKSYALPQGLKAYVVAEGSEDVLNYVALDDVIPAGTAVMLKGSNNNSKTVELTPTKAEPYIGQNLLMGSDEATLTYSFIKMPCLFYKLAYGHSNTPNAKVFAWYWGANNGEAFEIEGHRAWLAIPKTAAARMYPVFVDEDATGIEQATADNDETNEIYNLNGQRVAAPTKGMYIRNNKKVIIK